MSARFALFLLLGALLAACRREVPTVHQTPTGQLVLGEAEVLDPLERTVAPGGRTLVFEGFNGTLDLDGTDASEATLRFTRRARGSDDAEATEILEGVTVTESGDAAAYRFTMRTTDPSLTAVDVRGSVPRGTSIRIRLATGTVALRAIGGPLQVQIDNGTVEVYGAAAPVDIRARNGTLDVDMATLAEAAPVFVETQNGSITLALPATADAAVEAATPVGTVADEGLPFTERRLLPEGAGARFTGRLGTGAARVLVHTRNGAITLRPSRPPPPADSLAARPARPVRRDSTVRPLTAPADTLRPPAPASPPDTAGVPEPRRGARR